jgi:hypothetical protein
MRRFIFAALMMFASLVPTDAFARGGPGNKTFGLGLTLGIPTGITGKVYFGQGPSLEFGFGTIEPWGALGGWVDYEHQFYKIPNKRQDVLQLFLYVGAGLQAAFSGSYYYYNGPPSYLFIRGGRPYYYYAPGYAYWYNAPPLVALRVPFGLTIHWTRVTFDTFVEITPAVSILPYVMFTPGFSIGARYYF